MEEEWQHWIEKYLCPGDIIISSLSHPIDSSGGELIASEANKQSNHILLQVFFIWFTVLWVLAGSVHGEKDWPIQSLLAPLGHQSPSRSGFNWGISRGQWPGLRALPAHCFPRSAYGTSPFPRPQKTSIELVNQTASMPRTHSACASFLNILTPWCLDRCWARADRG